MKRIVLIAHDSKKEEMVEWTRFNRGTLASTELFATQATGDEVMACVGLEINLLMHGPAGGDAQVGAMIAERRVDALIFMWDPLALHPHDVDVKALLRLAVLYDVPTACNRRTADFLISSPLFQEIRPQGSRPAAIQA